jgi:hypothetical protein
MPVDRATPTLNVKMSESTTVLEPSYCVCFASSIKRTNAANSVASLSAQDCGVTPPQTLDALAGKFTGALVF